MHDWSEADRTEPAAFGAFFCFFFVDFMVISWGFKPRIEKIVRFISN